MYVLNTSGDILFSARLWRAENEITHSFLSIYIWVFV